MSTDRTSILLETILSVLGGPGARQRRALATLPLITMAGVFYETHRSETREWDAVFDTKFHFRFTQASPFR
jgi:hypothetical protein